MAKKLIFDYVFDASAKTITINGHISLKKLLFINNATRGTTLYALGDTNLKTTNRSYDANNDTTTYTLNFDTASAGHLDTDELQIFIDEEGAEFKPTETFIDPVSKLRVSTPNTLIDTDFEYGLQSTKWETLERIKEIPSFYSQNGDVPLEGITDILTVAGSKTVTVRTSRQHGLLTSTPIDIRGLVDDKAEGSYIIKAIPTEKTFTYELLSPASFTGSIFTVYTNLVIGRYYVNSKLNFGEQSAITTDAAATSTLTITTPYKNNFSIGTSFYITNSIAVKRVEFSGLATNFSLTGYTGGAVDYTEQWSSVETTSLRIWEPRGADVTEYSVTGAANINFTTDTITLPDHGLETGDMLWFSFVSPTITNGVIASGSEGVDARGTTGGNGIYYASYVDDNNFKLCATPQNSVTGSPVDIQSSNPSDAGLMFQFRRFGKGYSSTVLNIFEFDVIEVGDSTNPSYGRRQRYFRPEAINITDDTICIPNHGFRGGQPVIFQVSGVPDLYPAGTSNVTGQADGASVTVATPRATTAFVYVVDDNYIKLATSAPVRQANTNIDYPGNAAIGTTFYNFTDQGTNAVWGAPFSLWPCQKMINCHGGGATDYYGSTGTTAYDQLFASRNRIIMDYQKVGFEEGDRVCFFFGGKTNAETNSDKSSNGINGVWGINTNYSHTEVVAQGYRSDYQKRYYYVRYPKIETFNSKQTFTFSISTTPNGPLVDFGTNTSSHNNVNTDCEFVFKVAPISTANSFYMPNHGFRMNEYNQPIYWLCYKQDSTHTTFSTALQNFVNNVWYWMYPLSNDYFRVSRAYSTATASAIQTGLVQGAADANDFRRDEASRYLMKIASFTAASEWDNFTVKFRAYNHENYYKNTFLITNHGFAEGQSVRYNSAGNNDIQGIQSGETYYIKNATQNRFSLSTSYDGTIINLLGASTTSSPNHYFEDVSTKGSIDGAYTISAKDPNGYEYSVDTNQQIFGRTLSFKPQKTLNCTKGHFYYQNHNLSTGVSVVYTVPALGTAIGQREEGGPPASSEYNYLVSGNTYYVYRISKNFFALAETLEDAQAGNYMKEYRDPGNLAGEAYTHEIYADSVYGEVQGPGRIFYSTSDHVFDGSTVTISSWDNRVTIGTHPFRTGDYVEYNSFGEDADPIQGLEFGKNYYIRYESSTQITFHTTQNDAYRRRNPIKLYGNGAGTTHTLSNSAGKLYGSRNKGYWTTDAYYFVGDVVRFTNYDAASYYTGTTALPEYYVAVKDDQYNFDDLYNNRSNNEQNKAQSPIVATNLWPHMDSQQWRRLDDYKSSQSGASGLESNFGVQYTPSKKILINDERRTGWSGDATMDYGSDAPWYYQAGNAVPASNRMFCSNDNSTARDHGFYTGDCVFYDNEGYWKSVKFNDPVPPSDYVGLEKDTFYYVNVVDRSYFTLHTNPTDARSGINPISINDATAGTTAARSNEHRFYKFESRVVEVTIDSVTDYSEMTVQDPFQPTFINFDPQQTEPVEIVDNINEYTIYLPNYEDRLITGTEVIYTHDNDSTAIGGLTKNGYYYVNHVGAGYYRLYGNGNKDYNFRQDAYIGGMNDNVDFSSKGTGSNHRFIVLNRNYSAAEYLLPTSVYVKPSAYSLHRPFDGGVEINPGTSADSSIVRQTRRYFRYQSGKGLQYSTATNFNAPIEVRIITGDTDGASNPIARVVTRKPHRLSAGQSIIMRDVVVSSGINYYNGTFSVATVEDDYTFTYQLYGVPADIAPGGFPSLNKNGWLGAAVRAGMFDDQNGFFYEYDGQSMYVVRRSSTAQTNGVVHVTKDSQRIIGTNTTFTKQLGVDDMVVIRGQSYLITDIVSDTELIISRPYAGVNSTNVIMTKTVDTKIPQSQWNIDRCDGTSQSGYELDVTKLQMCYIDYSWYGGGKIRFGFKDQHGSVFYCHSFIHNNNFTEAYFRSGNLPARYEVKTFGDKSAATSFAPSLFHWGASVIMDGQFEDDKAYLFTATSPTLYLLNQKTDGDERQSTREYPILTIRLAPSVDSGLTGSVGTRDIINRMQLQLKQVSITLSDGGATAGSIITSGSFSPRKSATVRLLLNADLSKPEWTKQASPALSEVIYHNPTTNAEFWNLDDRYTNGIVIYEFRVGANESFTQDLGDIANLGNSILGGDYKFPNGPDTLTVVVIPDDEYTSTTLSYTNCNARITWTESQA